MEILSILDIIIKIAYHFGCLMNFLFLPLITRNTIYTLSVDSDEKTRFHLSYHHT